MTQRDAVVRFLTYQRRWVIEQIVHIGDDYDVTPKDQAEALAQRFLMLSQAIEFAEKLPGAAQQPPGRQYYADPAKA